MRNVFMSICFIALCSCSKDVCIECTYKYESGWQLDYKKVSECDKEEDMAEIESNFKEKYKGSQRCNSLQLIEKTIMY